MSEGKRQAPLGRPKLNPDETTVLIGFKGTQQLQNDLKAAAGALGINHSVLLRTVAEDCVEAMKKIKNNKCQ